jgi:hypothetical protein
MFYEAKAQMARQAYEEACKAFAMSHELEPKPVALYSHADCRETNGQLATALALFEDLDAFVREKTDSDSIVFRDIAKQRAAKLAPRVSKLSIRISDVSRVAGLEIYRDETRIDESRWNSAMPVDGGTYKVTARAPGHREWTTTVAVRRESDIEVVEIPVLVESAPSLASVAVSVPEPTPTVIPSPTLIDSPPAPRRSLVLPVVLGSGAIALGVTAILIERSGRSIYDDAREEPDRARQLRLLDTANNRRYTAEALGVAAVVSGGLATYFYIRYRRDRAKPKLTAVTSNMVGLAFVADW